MTSQTTAHIPAGTEVKAADAGAVRVTIVTAVGGYTVKCWQGTTQLDEWTRSYTTRRETKAAFDHAVAVFTTHRTPEGIDRYRTQLIWERDHRNTSRTRAAAIDAELDSLHDLTTRAQLPTFVATAARYAA